MSKKSPGDFVRFVLEQLTPDFRVRARAMFGGHGIYRDDTMFAIIEKNRLYFKVDDATRPAYTERGLSPFTYSARGRTVALQYYEAPPEVFEEPEIMQEWALQAVATAVRAARMKKPGTRRRGK